MLTCVAVPFVCSVLCYSPAADPRFAKRGTTASTEREPITGSGGGAPEGSSGRAPGGVRGAKPPETESLMSSFIKRWARS